MKTKMKLFFLVLTLGIFFVACDKSNDGETTPIIDDGVSEETIDDAIEMGTVSFNAFVKDIIEVTTGKPPALEDLLDEMVVQIASTDFTGTFITDNYRDLPANIVLIPGNYSLFISNYLSSMSRFDTPVHGAEIELFNVVAGSNIPLDIELALLDLAATINLSSDLALTYPDISVRVEYVETFIDPDVDSILNWSIADDGRTGYLSTLKVDFLTSELNITVGELNVIITATNSSGIPFTLSKTYLNAKANQHYKINIVQTADATASLSITLGDEEEINDTITFPN